jgi:hypothetical protein
VREPVGSVRRGTTPAYEQSAELGRLDRSGGRGVAPELAIFCALMIAGLRHSLLWPRLEAVDEPARKLPPRAGGPQGDARRDKCGLRRW